MCTDLAQESAVVKAGAGRQSAEIVRGPQTKTESGWEWNMADTTLSARPSWEQDTGDHTTHTHKHHQGHGQGEQHAGEPGGGDRGEREEKVVNRQRQVTLREVKPS